MSIDNFVSGHIDVEDGTSGTALSITSLPYCNGDFGASGFGPIEKEVSKYLSRGVLVGAAHTNPVFPSGSFSVMQDEFSDGTKDILIDMIRGTGKFAARVSTNTTLGTVIVLNLVFRCGAGTLTLPDTYFTFDLAEGDPSNVTFNWECWGTPTFAGPA